MPVGDAGEVPSELVAVGRGDVVASSEDGVARAPALDPLDGLLEGLDSPSIARTRALLDELGLIALGRRSALELSGQFRLEPRAARRLVAAYHFGRAVERERGVERKVVRSPEDVYGVVRPLVRGLEQEQFHALVLDTRHRLIEAARVSEGTLTTSLVHPREVYRRAIRIGAAAVVVAHNHPSGDPEPSLEDREVTRRLIDAGELLGIPLLDHVVIGDGAWVSMRARMPFERGSR